VRDKGKRQKAKGKIERTGFGCAPVAIRGAESGVDFSHKLQIALKELRESNYWLRLLEVSGKVPGERLADIIDESTQLRAILSKAVATTKANMK